MSEWKEYKLSDAPLEIIDGDRGVNYPKQNEFSNNDYCLFLNAKNVTASGFSFGDCNFISEKKDLKLRKGKLQRNDIVLTTRGTVGNIGYYDSKIPFDNIRINSGMVIIRPSPVDTCPAFIHQLFKFLKKDFDIFATGSAQPQLPIKDLNEITILLPPLPEQRVIAGVLSSLDDKIDLLHRQNKTLEAMAETLFRQWFVEPARRAERGAGGEAEAQSNKKMLLGDLIETVSETHRFPKPIIIFLNTSDIYLGKVITEEYKQVSELPGQAKKGIKKGDILFSEIRPANGRFAYIDFDAQDYVVSTKLMVLRSKGIISQAFVYFYLSNPRTLEWLQTLAEARSGTFPQITFDQIRELVINIPSTKFLDNSSLFCERLLAKINANNQSIKSIEQIRYFLLAKLMSGEVKIYA